MEFLDDLREQREAGKRPPKKQTSSQDRAGAAQDPWDGLLTGSSFDEREAAPATSRRREKRRRQKPARNAKPRRKAPPRRGMPRRAMSGGQKVLLGVLALVVVLLWAGIAAMLSGRLSLGTAFGAREPAMVDAVGAAPSPTVENGVPVPTATALPELTEEAEPTATPKPTQTPVPIPQVATVYDSQIVQRPDDVDLYLQRGTTYLSLGVYNAAEADFIHAIELNDQRVEAYLGLGWAQYYVFEWDGAKAAFDAAVLLNRESEAAHYALGLLAYYQGSYNTAFQEFDAAAEINPLNAEAEAWLAIAAAKVPDRREATDAAARALNVDQDLPIVYIARSWARRVAVPSDLEGAHADLLYALDLEPNQFATLNALASFYAEYRPDRLSEAEVRALHACEWAENDVERSLALQTLGRVYLALGRKEDAARILTSAMDFATHNGKVYLKDLEGDLDRAR